MMTRKPIHQARVGAVEVPRLIESDPIPANKAPANRSSKAFRFISEL
jgi:hypothetical protein